MTRLSGPEWLDKYQDDRPLPKVVTNRSTVTGLDC